MAIQDIEVTIDDSILNQYPQYDSVEGLVRAALANFDGETTDKEEDSKYGTGTYFDRGYNS
jgi:hypothetical protein